MCRAVAGSEAPIEYTNYRPGEEGQREAFSTEKAKKALGYTPKVGPRETIALTAEWVRGLVQFRTLGGPLL